MLISGFTILALFCVLCFTVALLCYYPVTGTRWYVYFFVFISWFLAFGMVALIPFDVLMVTCIQTISEDVLELETERTYLRYCWHAVYWSVFVLCWVVLPILQQYELAGEFSYIGRLRRAIRRLLWMYFLMGTAGLLFVIYLGFSGSLVIAVLPSVLVAFSNCWGLFQTIFLLGYGLIAVPRYLWFESNNEYYLKYLQYKATIIDEEMTDAQFQLDQLVKLANAADHVLSMDSPLRQYLDIILKQVKLTQCPKEDLEFHTQNKSHSEREVLEELGQVTKRKLEVMNRLLKQGLFNHHRAHSYPLPSQWDQLLTAAFNTQDLIHSRTSPDHIVQSVLWDRKKNRGRNTRILQWVWYIKIKPVLCKMLAVVLILASAFIVVGESTLFLDTPVGAIPLLFKESHGDWLTQLYCAIPLAYLGSCTYFALFRLKLSGFYGLYGQNQTDSPCLAWNACFLARMSCPLSLNFLLYIKVEGAEFFKVMSVINFVPFMGKGFCMLFPLLLVVFCLLNLFNVYPIVMEWIGIPQFIISGRFNIEKIGQGLILLRRARERAEDTPGREQNYTKTIGRSEPVKAPLI